MKRLKKILFSLLLLFEIAGGLLYAQVIPPGSATGHIIAEIIPVFSATETSQMNFGRFAPGPEGGKIILTPQGTISIQGNVFKGPGTFNAASFNVFGDADAAYSISLPSGPVILKHTSESKTMTVEDWLSVPSAGIGTGRLPQDGFQTVFVGATLKVGSINDNPVGIYTGLYNITFDFY